jgi:antitoxin VapB
MAAEKKARVFWSGRSQAVRLPREFRFDVDEVVIRRRGAAVILEPVATDWAWLDELAGSTLDDDMVKAALEATEQERPEFDRLFE